MMTFILIIFKSFENVCNFSRFCIVFVQFYNILATWKWKAKNCDAIYIYFYFT